MSQGKQNSRKSTSNNSPVNVNETELIREFLSNQSKELSNQKEEIELRKLNEKNAYSYGCKALEVQQQDRKESREQATSFMKYGFALTIVVLLLLSAFVGGCIYTGNIGLIVSVMKVLAYVVPSTLGGYFIGINRGRKKGRNESSDSVPYAEVEEE
ncbi:hypothetical protein [Salegentibacter sp. UBA1130]|uniref:hypothetical protein n=1 Tax=Salegentibacter sp. UBA1130 TaxID=1947451 RepID=UPI00257E10E7|nr:hypothetical protein [Salegentibacter sp. UBA1130]